MKKMKDRLMHNLGLKVMALLFSVVLWMVAVDINDPSATNISTMSRCSLSIPARLFHRIRHIRF